MLVLPQGVGRAHGTHLRFEATFKNIGLNDEWYSDRFMMVNYLILIHKTIRRAFKHNHA